MSDAKLSTPTPTSPVEYRDVRDFPGYRIGNDGTFRSIYTGCIGVEWHDVEGSITRKGYRVFCLKKGNGRRTIFAHKLVLEAFVGPCPAGMWCRHLDGDPANNRLENICWDTPKANQADKRTHGTVSTGERNGNHKLTAEDVRSMRRLRAEGASCKEIGSRFQVDYRYVYKIIRGRNWTET